MIPTVIRLLAAACAWLALAGCKSHATLPETERPHVLVFTKTAGFRHDSIPAGQEAIRLLADQGDFNVSFTEDATVFTPKNLSRYKAVVFLNTSGDVLNSSQEPALEEFIVAGGGFVGVHAAADTEHDWPWYAQLVGARFKNHPAIQPAEIIVHDQEHASTRHLPARWARSDEWYNFDQHPRNRVGNPLRLLASIDESTYTGGEMTAEHPVSWCHPVGQGRAWYTAGGHTTESYREPLFVEHLRGGILWAMKVDGRSAKQQADR
jgi:type 1 glutamine amidotransferase